MPYIRSGSGSDGFTKNLAAGLEQAGHTALLHPFSRYWQVLPDLLRGAKPSVEVDVIVANSSNGFAFATDGIPMVTVTHHCVHDPAFAPFRSVVQALYHQAALRRYEARSFRTAAEVVAVSFATRRAMLGVFKGVDPRVIRNGVDTSFFSPGSKKPMASRPFRLLYAGNMTKRKGADLLDPTMRLLGPGHILEYTSGLRRSDLLKSDNTYPLGRLSLPDLREAYRRADALFLPSRLEGGPLVAFEAMACGLPVVSSNLSAMPEVITHRQNGLLCNPEPRDFATAIQSLADDRRLLKQLADNARIHAVENLSRERMTEEFLQLFEELRDREAC